jgi:hypothetical protein
MVPRLKRPVKGIRRTVLRSTSVDPEEAKLAGRSKRASPHEFHERLIHECVPKRGLLRGCLLESLGMAREEPAVAALEQAAPAAARPQPAQAASFYRAWGVDQTAGGPRENLPPSGQVSGGSL